MKSISIQKLSSVIRLHCPTLRQTQLLINLHRTQWESVLMSVSVQYEHLHTILYNPFLLVSVLVSVSGNVNTLWSLSQRSYFWELILHACPKLAWFGHPKESIYPQFIVMFLSFLNHAKRSYFRKAYSACIWSSLVSHPSRTPRWWIICHHNMCHLSPCLRSPQPQLTQADTNITSPGAYIWPFLCLPIVHLEGTYPLTILLDIFIPFLSLSHSHA